MFRRIFLPVANALLWFWTGARLVMDWIGRSTVVDDAIHAAGLIDRAASWVLGTPWWVPATLATATTAALILFALYPTGHWYQNLIRRAWKERDYGNIQGEITFDGGITSVHRANVVGPLIWNAPSKTGSFWLTLTFADGAGPLTIRGFSSRDGDRIKLFAGAKYKFYVQRDPDWAMYNCFDANKPPQDIVVAVEVQKPQT